MGSLQRSVAAALVCLALGSVGCPGEEVRDDTSIKAESHYLAGSAYMRKGDAEAAVVEFSKATQLDPNLTRAWHSMGKAWLVIGREKDAEKAFRKALELDPKKFISWMGLGHALRGQGKPDAARNAYAKAQALDPDSAEPHRYLGDMARNAGDVEAAIKHFTEAAKVDSGDMGARPFLDMAQMLKEQGRLPEAEKAYMAAIERTEQAIQGWRERAKMFEEAGATADDGTAMAQNARDRLAFAENDLVELWKMVGDVRLDEKNLEGARSAYQEALTRNPNDEVIWLLVAALEESQGRTGPALAAWTRATEIAPDSARAWEGLGRAQLTSGDEEAAKKSAMEALDALAAEGSAAEEAAAPPVLGQQGPPKDIDDPEVITSVAELLLAVKNYEASGGLFKMLSQDAMSRWDPRPWVGLARVAEATKDTAELDRSCMTAKVALERLRNKNAQVASGMDLGPCAVEEPAE